EVVERHGDYIRIEVKNRFVVGDSLELMTPQGNITFNLTEMRDLKGNPITDAKGSGHFVEIPLSQEVDISYALLIRNLPHAKESITASTLAYSTS
ncbi:TPA: U32 family peptidase C-terminal domain-containing protein, partial [Acinetobacter baumannii]|nr:U32 family peptidase C-terminal domain-containing protein [Acinetobacter baumannii]HCW4951200.1 U32 family peptidase C-terminal domain-containing protein [Acinetobacter baumannii]